MIVAVTGGKGGVGASTVAYNLGAELDAVVVDADLSMADLPGARGPALHAVLAGRIDPVEAVREDGPVARLPCERSLAGARAAEPTALAEAVAAVAGTFGEVVVDSPTGRGAGTALALQTADACVIVTTPEPVALADAVRTRALARRVDTPLAGVVLNRTAGDPAVGTVEAALGARAVAVPDSSAVAASLARGRPVSVLAPDAPAVERFATLARRVQHSRRS